MKLFALPDVYIYMWSYQKQTTGLKFYRGVYIIFCAFFSRDQKLNVPIVEIQTHVFKNFRCDVGFYFFILTAFTEFGGLCFLLTLKTKVKLTEGVTFGASCSIRMDRQPETTEQCLCLNF